MITKRENAPKERYLRKLKGHLFFLYVYLFMRDRDSMSGGGVEREGDTESKGGSRLRAVNTEPDVGLELTNREIVT